MQETLNTVLTAGLLRKAATLAEEIETKQNELTALLSGGSITCASSPKTKVVGGKRVFSEAVRAKIAAGQKARWEKVHAAKAAKASTSTPATAPVSA